jgi:hypothetical protein
LAATPVLSRKSFTTSIFDLPAPLLAIPLCSTSLLSTAVMAQIRGTAGYHLGNQSPFGNAGRNDGTTNDPSPLDQLREQTNKIEDFLDTLSDPIKP